MWVKGTESRNGTLSRPSTYTILPWAKSAEDEVVQNGQEKQSAPQLPLYSPARSLPLRVSVVPQRRRLNEKKPSFRLFIV